MEFKAVLHWQRMRTRRAWGRCLVNSHPHYQGWCLSCSISVTSLKQSSMQTVMTMTEIWPMVNQQEATISKFINKCPVYICGQLLGENVLEWQVVAAYRSVGLWSDGSCEMHQSCVSWGGSLPSWSTRLVLLGQGRLYTEVHQATTSVL